MKRHFKNRTVYRLYTEDKNRNALTALVSSQFKNFSAFLGTAYWHGKKEYTIVIEIVEDGQCKNPMARIKFLVECIKHLNNQEEILLTETKTDIRFLT